MKLSHFFALKRLYAFLSMKKRFGWPKSSTDSGPDSWPLFRVCSQPATYSWQIVRGFITCDQPEKWEGTKSITLITTHYIESLSHVPGWGVTFLISRGTVIRVETPLADTMPELCTFVYLMALCVKNIIQVVLIFNCGWIMYKLWPPHYTHALSFSELIVTGDGAHS